MLVVDKLQAAYGPAPVLFDISFSVMAAEVATRFSATESVVKI